MYQMIYLCYFYLYVKALNTMESRGSYRQVQSAGQRRKVPINNAFEKLSLRDIVGGNPPSSPVFAEEVSLSCC